jgi:Polyketide cyclase / dehydrase and lipid transport
MAEFELIDEAIIDAKPETVYKALIEGGIRYKMNAETRRIQGSAADQIGALIEIRVRGRFPINWTIKTVEVKENELWCTRYVGGVFRGEGTWKLEAIGDNTKVSYYWHTRPSGLLRILAPFVNVPKQHHELMKSGFKSLKEYIKDKTSS